MGREPTCQGIPEVVVGFTGSRDGVTFLQRFNLRYILYEHLCITEAHHGNCVGSDSVFAELVFPRFRTVAHPCDIPSLQLTRTTAHEYRPVKPPLDRNKDIVNACMLLLACPQEMTEITRSGTWSTIRYARRIKKPVWILYPDGSSDFGEQSV